MEFLKSGDNVLIIWNNSEQNDIANFVNEVKCAVNDGNVFLENSSMIAECKFNIFMYVIYSLFYSEL